MSHNELLCLLTVTKNLHFLVKSARDGRTHKFQGVLRCTISLYHLKNMFRNILKCFEMFRNVSKCFKMFRNVSKLQTTWLWQYSQMPERMCVCSNELL